MPHENGNYISNGTGRRPREVVSLPVPLYRSIERRYFVGQTDIMKVRSGLSAWAGLVNPHNSNTTLYANVFTVSNFSDEYLVAEVWLNINFPEKSKISHKVSPTNTALRPLPKNKVDIKFTESTAEDPESGINVYERIVPPNTTLVAEEDGKFIEAPDGNYTIVLKSQSSNESEAIVALGWWEKTVNCK
ncbi:MULTISPECIES: DUF6143 family protein [Clostridium]|uniref:DUF6143 family protein n=1 Tax=Clostridium TaxID=1485 RepID=UPI0008253BF7|nr:MULTISPECIES: DUF6143 family protein [Clostridium]PJI08611.1 hypothetical protein CUB90_12395 [Clostridium sp. CT7]